MNDNLIRTAIYGRVSTEEQAEQGYSIEAQRSILREYCRKNGRAVYDEYFDEGVSGKSMEGRHQLQRLLADARVGKFQEVVVWKTNRLARNLLDLQQIAHELERNGVSFRSYSEPFETATPAGRLLFNVLGSIGEFERSTIVENVKMGMRQRAKEGHWNGGVVLGYRTAEDEQKSRLEVVPEEAALVYRIFDLYATGLGLWSVANRLNIDGHRTKLGNTFGPQAIAKILDNPIYVGKVRYDVQRDWSQKRRKGTSKEPIIVDGHHEPIIPADLWSRVRALRAAKASKPPRTFYGEYPLTGLMRCPQCGARMVAGRTHNKLKSGQTVIRRYYVCGNHRNKGKAVCQANGINADKVEALVLKRLSDLVQKPKVLQDVVKRMNENRDRSAGPLRAELEVLDRNLAQIETRQKKYFALYESDRIDSEALVQRLEDLRKESAGLTARKAEIDRQLESYQAEPVNLGAVRETLKRFNDLVKAASPEQLKTLLQLVITEIEVTKDRQIDRIKIRFDESIQPYLEEETPSAVTGTEGVSSVVRLSGTAEPHRRAKFSLIV